MLLSGFVVLLTKIPVQAPKGALLGLKPGSRTPNPGYGPGAKPQLVAAYGELPLSFEINEGQTDSQVKFLSRGSGYSLFLTGNEAVLALKKPIQMPIGKRCGAGRHPSRWHREAGVPG